MTITINVSPEAEWSLGRQAEQSGLAIQEYVQRIVEACAAAPSASHTDQRSTLFDAEDPLIFTTPEGERYLQPSLPSDGARFTVPGGEATLRKFWDTPEEDAGCQALLGGM